MRDPRVRLLIGPGIQDHERKAAIEAAESFRPFGLKVEVIADPGANVWKDRCREQVFELVFGRGLAVIRGESHFYEPVYPVPNDGALLAGVTEREIEWVPKAGGAFRGGFSLDGVGCVVSVAGLRPVMGEPYRGAGPADASETAEALRFALMKELGHALIGKTPYWTRGVAGSPQRYDDEGYCLSGGCILERTGNYISYLRGLGGARAEFCRGCADLLESRVRYVDSLGCA